MQCQFESAASAKRYTILIVILNANSCLNIIGIAILILIVNVIVNIIFIIIIIII